MASPFIPGDCYDPNEYTRGYNDGYNAGYTPGYNSGEYDGYYDGEDDGYEWAQQIAPLAAEVVQAASAAARRAGWSIRAGNRGRPSDEEVTLIAERIFGSEPGK